MKKLGLLIATFFNVGHIPIAPGPAASFIVTVTVYFIYATPPPLYIQIAAIVLVFLIGIPAATQAELVSL